MQYWENVRMLVNWQKLTNVQREIILHLLHKGLHVPPHKPIVNGNYTDLTKELNRPKTHVPNVRKAAIDLENRGLILIIGEKPTEFYLRHDWQKKLTDMSLFPEDNISLANVKREHIH